MTPNDGTHGPAGVQDVLRTEQIAMSFGPVVALRSVDLHLPRGEILGLVGDNGAGKSTLVKILTGLYRPDRGRIYLNGEEVKFRSVRHARQHGIETVFQDLALVGELSVYHNLFLNREQTRGGWFRFLSNRAMRAAARRFLDDIGVDIPSVDTPVAKLSGRRTSRSCCSTSPAAMGAKETSLIIELIKSLSKPVLLPSVANTPRQIGFEISGARITCAALRSSRSATMRNDRLRKFAPLSGLELIAGNRPCLSRNQSTDEW
jgi:ABC-type Fe3+/spermidine/putrescine transport system ATPase subunit